MLSGRQWDVPAAQPGAAGEVCTGGRVSSPSAAKSVAQGHEEPTVLAQLAMKLGNLTSPPVLP